MWKAHAQYQAAQEAAEKEGAQNEMLESTNGSIHRGVDAHTSEWCCIRFSY